MDNNNKYSDQGYDDTFSLKNFFLLCLGYWKWFLISLVVCVGIGLFYIYTRQPVYERSEEILVKDQETGGGAGEITNSFSQLGLFANSTKVYNELISFTSPAVMMKVVEELDLTMNYVERDGLKRYTLFRTNLPVKVEFLDQDQTQTVGMKLIIKPDGKFEAKKMWKYVGDSRVKYDDEVTGTINGPAVKSSLGSIMVMANDDYFGEIFPEGKERNIDVLKKSFLGAVEEYVAKLKGDLVDQDADVINLSIKDSNIERADAILNAVVEVYNQRWIEDNNKVSVATSKFISERLLSLEQELGEVDETIAAQKSEMKVPDMEEAAKSIYAQDLMVSTELLRANTMLSMARYLKEYVTDPANALEVIPMNTGIENITLEEQIGKYNQALFLRNNLADNSSADNPLVVSRDKELATMRASIVQSINSNIANLENSVKNIEKAKGNTLGQLGTAPQQAMKLLSAERQQEVMQELYLYLLQKREENELSQSFIADNIRVITPPYGKQKPVSPNKPLLVIISVILGLGIPAGLLFLLEAANTKIRSKKDVENLPIPFAGEIPHIGKTRKFVKLFQSKKKKMKEIDKPKIVVAEGKRDIPNEAFRVVRSNIDFMLEKGVPAALALTSFNPGSGKSFVAFNLGASFALKGKKVLIIDGDLRHGSISGYVNSPRKGLTTFLNGTVSDWESLVVRVEDTPNLYVLPIGHRPPNPAELLDNGRLETLITEAKKDYDIVLIDCPPVNIVVDTQIINQFVSRTIFVVRAGLLEKKALNDITNLVGTKKLNNMTLLLNGTKTEFSSYHTYGNYEAYDKI